MKMTLFPSVPYSFLAVSFACVAFFGPCVWAADPPAQLTQAVSHGGQTATMRLTRQDLRGSDFELWAQEADGSYTVLTPVAERSYLGTVDEFPDALASGILQDNGVFRGAIYFDRGRSWFTSGSSVAYTRGDAQPAKFGHTSEVTGPGQAGNVMHGFTVGMDVDSDFFATRAGGNRAKAFELVEFSVAATRALYMQDMLMRPYLGRVILRTSRAQDPPYKTADGGTRKKGGDYLSTLRSEWNNNQQDAVRDVVAGISTGHVGGGLAWLGVIGTSSAYSVNDSGADGEFTIIWRHELGHNWGLGHYDGGAPEGSTINSNNQYARMSGSELLRALDHRDSRIHRFPAQGTYTAVNIPPYASLDAGEVVQGDPAGLSLNPLANDHDANGHALTLVSAQPRSVEGGTISMQGSMLLYQPHPGFLGTDSFTYQIQDSSGQTATGAVAVQVLPPDALRLYLPLDETDGSVARDRSIFGLQGNVTGTDFATGSITGKFRQALSFDGVDDKIEVSGLGLTSNTITLAGWIRPDGGQAAWSGLFFSRSGAACGLNYGTGGELRYHWNDEAATYNWSSGLKPAAGAWSFVALVVAPDKATIYLWDGATLRSASRHGTHNPGSLGTLTIGRDPNSSGRSFKGAMDEVRAYDKSLSAATLQVLIQGGAAESPRPFDGAQEIGETGLGWAPAGAAIRYHVYLGTKANEVAQATSTSPEYLGETAVPEWPNPPTTTLKKYYWRVDVETALGVIPGPVWSFSRNDERTIRIQNPSFEIGALGVGTPPAWSRVSSDPSRIGIDPGGIDGVQILWIGPEAKLRQDLSETARPGETLTLSYRSSRNYARKISLQVRKNATYQTLASTSEAFGSGAWPIISFSYSIQPGDAGFPLSILIESGNWNEFDDFRLTAAGGAATPPHDLGWSAGTIDLPVAMALLDYAGPALHDYTNDSDGNPLVFAKMSGPSWLQISPAGVLSGTPGLDDVGENIFVASVHDPLDGDPVTAELRLTVEPANFYYDRNGASAGSGVDGGGNWAEGWSVSPLGDVPTHPWVDGAHAIFSAGTDPTGAYLIVNTGTRAIGGLTFRHGVPQITGGRLALTTPATPVEVHTLQASVDSALTGGGGLEKTGGGTLVLSGANDFAGSTVVSSGVLDLRSSLPGATRVTSGAILTGFGTVSGRIDVESEAVLEPTQDHFLSADSLTFHDGSVFHPLGAVAVMGDLQIGESQLTLVGAPLASRVLLRYTGTRQGLFSPVGLAQGWEILYDDAAGEIRLARVPVSPAAHPQPIDGATDVGETGLAWAASPDALRYHVYFGTDAAAVAAATTASPEYLGVTPYAEWPVVPTQKLETYYWRVDIEALESVVTGQVWSFSRDNSRVLKIENPSFEIGGLGDLIPPGWSWVAGASHEMGIELGGVDGEQALFLGPGAKLRQDLSASARAHETLTLTYRAGRAYPHTILLQVRDGEGYRTLAQTSEGTGSGQWPVITLTYESQPRDVGRPLSILIESEGWNEFDDFRLTARGDPAPDLIGYDAWIAGHDVGHAAGREEDADGDGISNYLEFVLGGDPTVANDTPFPALVRGQSGGFRYVFQIQSRAVDFALVSVEFSADLQTWPVENVVKISPVADPDVVILPLDGAGQVEVPLSGDDQQRYLRLRVERAAP